MNWTKTFNPSKNSLMNCAETQFNRRPFNSLMELWWWWIQSTVDPSSSWHGHWWLDRGRLKVLMTITLLVTFLLLVGATPILIVVIPNNVGVVVVSYRQQHCQLHVQREWGSLSATAKNLLLTRQRSYKWETERLCFPRPTLWYHVWERQKLRIVNTQKPPISHLGDHQNKKFNWKFDTLIKILNHACVSWWWRQGHDEVVTPGHVSWPSSST